MTASTNPRTAIYSQKFISRDGRLSTTLILNMGTREVSDVCNGRTFTIALPTRIKAMDFYSAMVSAAEAAGDRLISTQG